MVSIYDRFDDYSFPEEQGREINSLVTEFALSPEMQLMVPTVKPAPMRYNRKIYTGYDWIPDSDYAHYLRDNHRHSTEHDWAINKSGMSPVGVLNASKLLADTGDRGRGPVWAQIIARHLLTVSGVTPSDYYTFFNKVVRWLTPDRIGLPERYKFTLPIKFAGTAEAVEFAKLVYSKDSFDVNRMFNILLSVKKKLLQNTIIIHDARTWRGN